MPNTECQVTFAPFYTRTQTQKRVPLFPLGNLQILCMRICMQCSRNTTGLPYITGGQPFGHEDQVKSGNWVSWPHYKYCTYILYLCIKRNRYSDSLRAGRSGDRIPVGERFSAPVQADPGGPPSLLYKGYRVLSGGKAAGAWCWPPPQIFSAGVLNWVELYLYLP